MPNYVTNIVNFRGAPDHVKKLRNRIAGGEDQPLIDFDSIFPIPTELSISSGSSEQIAEVLLKDCGNSFGIGQDRYDKMHKKLLGTCLNAEKGPLCHAIKNLDIDNMDEDKWESFSELITKNFEFIKSTLGFNENDFMNCEDTLTYLNNKRRYGHTSWYQWCISNWGTKWNASDACENGDGISFDTAWSTPVPILREISRIFPTVELEVLYADEDIGSNCGMYIISGGEVVNEVDKDGDDEFACRIKGYDYDEYMDDE